MALCYIMFNTLPAAVFTCRIAFQPERVSDSTLRSSVRFASDLLPLYLVTTYDFWSARSLAEVAEVLEMVFFRWSVFSKYWCLDNI